jgi:hypothetical protein
MDRAGVKTREIGLLHRIVGRQNDHQSIVFVLCLDRDSELIAAGVINQRGKKFSLTGEAGRSAGFRVVV